MKKKKQTEEEIEQAISNVNNPLMAKVLELLRKGGVRFSSVSFGDGYYIFEFGKETVCRFKAEGARRWLFGIWAFEDENPDTHEKTCRVHLFGEHEDYIDKFKPTQTALSFGLEKCGTDDLEDRLSIMVYQFLDDLRAIKAHPALEKYFRYSARTGSVARFLLSDFWFYRIKNPISKRLETRGSFLWLKLAAAAYRLRFRFSKARFDANVYDRGKGWVPRYELRAVYGQNDDNTVRDIYMKLQKRYDDENGMPRVKYWLIPECVGMDMRFINAEDEYDRLGFVYVDKDED